MIIEFNEVCSLADSCVYVTKKYVVKSIILIIESGLPYIPEGTGN